MIRLDIDWPQQLRMPAAPAKRPPGGSIAARPFFGCCAPFSARDRAAHAKGAARDPAAPSTARSRRGRWMPRAARFLWRMFRSAIPFAGSCADSGGRARGPSPLGYALPAGATEASTATHFEEGGDGSYDPSPGFVPLAGATVASGTPHLVRAGSRKVEPG